MCDAGYPPPCWFELDNLPDPPAYIDSSPAGPPATQVPITAFYASVESLSLPPPAYQTPLRRPRLQESDLELGIPDAAAPETLHPSTRKQRYLARIRGFGDRFIGNPWGYSFVGVLWAMLLLSVLLPAVVGDWKKGKRSFVLE
ncbi:hypothetical protein FN846DRAFT_894859 [Sphaerosporella brunnea]|uniref:Uncharacterized protein n=1 Tax=Sphaerosporella brunnea TaxID=1250544 RepID=A0A5J5EJ19_9PEZI|nr:hypothetical protein FN846DRAFT_894859 [Sphaerosporella brunnea]